MIVLKMHDHIVMCVGPSLSAAVHENYFLSHFFSLKTTHLTSSSLLLSLFLLIFYSGLFINFGKIPSLFSFPLVFPPSFPKQRVMWQGVLAIKPLFAVLSTLDFDRLWSLLHFPLHITPSRYFPKCSLSPPLLLSLTPGKV